MQPSPFKSSVNYGAMCGLAGFAMFLIIYWMGFNPLGQASLLGIWIPPLFVYLSVKYYRNEILNGGPISFMEAFRAGFLTAASGALLYALIVFIFGQVIDPNLLDNYKEVMISDLEATESSMRSIFGDGYYDAVYEDFKNKTMSGLASGEFGGKIIGGIFYSIIFALILKRNPAKSI